MRRRSLSMMCVLIVFFAICRIPSAAQVLYGSIVGTVQDSTGGGVPKAKVTLVGKGTGVSRETETDEAGRYSVSSVLPGTYDLKVAAPGFRAYTRSDITLTINTVTREDVKLQLGQISEQVSVVAEAVVLHRGAVAPFLDDRPHILITPCIYIVATFCDEFMCNELGKDPTFSVYWG